MTTEYNQLNDTPDWVGGKTYATAAEAALHRSADQAEGLGALIYTDGMLAQRMKAAAKSKDVVLAHFQAAASEMRMELENEEGGDGRVIMVYHVERLARPGKEGSAHEVELSHTTDGHQTATCGCFWYLERRSETPETVCVHILKAVEMHRLRTGQAMPEVPAAEPRKRSAKAATDTGRAVEAAEAVATRRQRKPRPRKAQAATATDTAAPPAA